MLFTLSSLCVFTASFVSVRLRVHSIPACSNQEQSVSAMLTIYIREFERKDKTDGAPATCPVTGWSLAWNLN